MWKTSHFFEVSVEERLEFNHKIEEAFKKRGHVIEIDEDTPEPYIAYMNYNKFLNEFSFGCGSFWYEERNIIPVVAMTHELGHFIDVSENFDGNIVEYHKTLGTKELEARAWFYAVEVCREIGFNRWEVFFRYARHCLESYFNDPFGFHDFRYGFTGQSPTLENALMRLQDRIGLRFEEEKVERVEFVDAPSSFKDLFIQIQKLQEAMRRTAEVQAQIQLEPEETDPMKRLLKRKREAQKSLKKHLGAKSWEL
jgi:hypothetical protein